MYQSILKKILGRFRRVDYEFLVENWAPLSDGLPENVDLKKITKAGFVTAVAKNLKNEISADLVADLDLFYLQRYPNKQVWKVYKVERVPGKKTSKPLAAHVFEKKLRKEVQLYLNADVHCEEHQNILWIRVAVEPEQKESRSIEIAPAYIVNVPGSDYVFTRGMRVSHRMYIMQAMVTLLKGRDELTDLHLSGHHLLSLIRMVLRNNSQEEESPIPGLERIEPEEELPPEVYNENTGEKRNRDKFLQDTYGPNKQPKLEKLEYKLETKFKGHSHVPLMSNKDMIFHCRVKFEGPNVLEGIRNLAAAGLADLPMKGHIGKVHTMATNVFRLKQNA